MFKKEFLESQIVKYRTEKLKGLDLDKVEDLYQEWIQGGGKPLGVDDIYDKYLFLISCQNRNIPVSLDVLVHKGLCDTPSYADWASQRITGVTTTGPNPIGVKKPELKKIKREDVKMQTQTQEVKKANPSIEQMLKEGSLVKGSGIPAKELYGIETQPVVVDSEIPVDNIPEEIVTESLASIQKVLPKPEESVAPVPMQLTITGGQEPVIQDVTDIEMASSLEELEDYLRIFNRKLHQFKTTKSSLSPSAVAALVRGLKRTSMDVEDSMRACRKTDFQ